MYFEISHGNIQTTNWRTQVPITIKKAKKWGITGYYVNSRTLMTLGDRVVSEKGVLATMEKAK